MDYIALNQQATQPRGIIYNSRKPVGGVRYYQAEKQVVTTQDDKGEVKTIVYIKAANPEPKRRVRVLRDDGAIDHVDPNTKNLEEETLNLISSKLKDMPAGMKPVFNPELLTVQSEYQEQDLIAIEKQIEAEPVEANQEEQVSEEINYASNYDDYIVNIGGVAVNFTQMGVDQIALNHGDKEWLAKAQHYFIKAREDGRAIGSAESYTTTEILEALWSTATRVGIDPKRFIVQIYNESRFNPYVEGAAGERGIGQFKESTAKMCGYSWDMMTAGIEGFAYQARASAEFVKRVGEIAYNGSGDKALQYQDKIGMRLEAISNN